MANMDIDVIELAERKRSLHAVREVDPVTARVIRSAMETICFEMAVYVSRTAISPILNQSNERNATILDAEGRLAALSVGIPQLMLQSTLPVRFALDFFGRDQFREGDVFLGNDPYHGAGHLPDYNVYAPCFSQGRLICIASIQCHHGDTGGSVPGGYNVTVEEVWGEGTRWPAIKVVDRGEERSDVLYALQANNRLSAFEGDIRAQIGAAQLGVKRLGGLISRYGAQAVEESIDWNIEHSAKRFSEEVASWPDGVYESDVYVDHDPRENKDIHIHLSATVQGEHLHLDFAGTDDRDELQAWSTYGNTRGYAIAAIAALMDPSIPKNEGFFDSVSLNVPQGCVLNPPTGKAVSAGTHHPGIEVGEAIAVALSKVCSKRSAPQVYKTGIPTTIMGNDPHSGKRFIDNSAEVYAGWCSAVEGLDGWGAFNAAFGNLWKATAEINESIFPHIQWSRDYRTDSGGPGKWRGGLGSHYVKEILVPAKVYTYVVGMKYPMPGIAKGLAGEPNKLTLREGSSTEEVVHCIADWVSLEAGDRIAYDYGGGGGWGDPLERDPNAVLDDVLDEYVSEVGALRDYGVVLSGSLLDLSLEVDFKATELERARRIASRDVASRDVASSDQISNSSDSMDSSLRRSSK